MDVKRQYDYSEGDYYECETEIKINVTYRLPSKTTPTPKHDFRYVRAIEKAVGAVKGTHSHSAASATLKSFKVPKEELQE